MFIFLANLGNIQSTPNRQKTFNRTWFGKALKLLIFFNFRLDSKGLKKNIYSRILFQRSVT